MGNLAHRAAARIGRRATACPDRREVDKVALGTGEGIHYRQNARLDRLWKVAPGLDDKGQPGVVCHKRRPVRRPALPGRGVSLDRKVGYRLRRPVSKTGWVRVALPTVWARRDEHHRQAKLVTDRSQISARFARPAPHQRASRSIVMDDAAPRAGILNPARLPVPPLRQPFVKKRLTAWKSLGSVSIARMYLWKGAPAARCCFRTLMGAACPRPGAGDDVIPTCPVSWRPHEDPNLKPLAPEANALSN